jgi:hypothetical protein
MPFSRARFRKEEVTLRRLLGDNDIASVLSLREEIDLSVHATADGGFYSLEKKEMNVGSLLRSILMIGVSAPSEWSL